MSETCHSSTPIKYASLVYPSCWLYDIPNGSYEPLLIVVFFWFFFLQVLGAGKDTGRAVAQGNTLTPHLKLLVWTKSLTIIFEHIQKLG